MYNQLHYCISILKLTTSQIFVKKIRNCTIPYYCVLIIHFTHYMYTVKKGNRFFRPQPGCLKPNSPYPGMSRPGRVWLVTSRLGTEKSLTFFPVYARRPTEVSEAEQEMSRSGKCDRVENPSAGKQGRKEFSHRS